MKKNIRDKIYYMYFGFCVIILVNLSTYKVEYASIFILRNMAITIFIILFIRY